MMFFVSGKKRNEQKLDVLLTFKAIFFSSLFLSTVYIVDVRSLMSIFAPDRVFIFFYRIAEREVYTSVYISDESGLNIKNSRTSKHQYLAGKCIKKRQSSIFAVIFSGFNKR